MAIFFDVLATILCVAMAATAAGLTMGIVSLDALDLRVIQRTGSIKEKSYASRLLTVIDREPRHHVLVTLLLLNSVANEAMPIFLDALVPTWAAVVVSVTAVLLFGEILPSAVFTGPQKLRIASTFSPVVTCALYVLWPLAYPMAALLDRCLPEDAEKRYTSRQEVRALVDVQRDDARLAGLTEPFSEDEADLVRGAMSLSTTSVSNVMVPSQRVFTLRDDQYLDAGTVRAIYDAGFSRIPIVRDGVWSKYLLVKDVLLQIVSNTVTRIGDLPSREPIWIGPDHSLFDLLNNFQTGMTHMAFVGSSTAVVGIVTLEDIIEEILTEEIYDEADRANALNVIQVFFTKYALPKLREKHDSTTPLLNTRSSSTPKPPARKLSRSGFSENSARSKPPRRRARTISQSSSLQSSPPQSFAQKTFGRRNRLPRFNRLPTEDSLV